MKNRFLQLKRTLIDQNIYFSLQLLLVWALFRVLGFIGVSTALKVLISIGAFFVLFLNWINVIDFVMNSIFFQYFIFINMFIVNLLIRSKISTFLFAFVLSFISFITCNGNDSIIVGDVRIFLGHINVIFICLFLLIFIKNLAERVFFKEMEGIFFVCIDSPKDFVWVYVLNLLESFLDPHVNITNKIRYDFLNKVPFLNFPFSFEFLQELSKPQNNLLTFYKKNGGVELKDESARQTYHEFRSNRATNLNKYIVEHRIRNNNFYKLICLGFLLGFVFGTAYLNGMLF